MLISKRAVIDFTATWVHKLSDPNRSGLCLPDRPFFPNSCPSSPSIPSFIKITDGKVHDVNVLDDLVIEPGAFYIMDRGYLDVRYFDAEQERRFAFLTNNFLVPALTIAQLYKCRWQVELFFKWIKQHLHIKAFYGTSENAVKTQIWIAISIYVLVAIIKKRLNLDESL